MIVPALAAVALAAQPTPGLGRSAVELGVEWDSPDIYVEAEAFHVEIEFEVPAEGGAVLSAWQLTPAAFTINGRPLAERPDGERIELEAGSELSLALDLGPAIARSEHFQPRDFRLGYGDERGQQAKEITFLRAAEKGIDFMELPLAQLDEYDVVLHTSRGDMWVRFWPDVAPGHVRNFLDLCYTGFYDGTSFHRVEPTYMIQGGRAKPGFEPPRTLEAEFSRRRHVPGVVSMARLPDHAPDSPHTATSEFFIMHGVAPSLDGEYTAFGKLVTGLDVVDKIAHSGNKSYRPQDQRAHVPPVDQVIHKAIVVKAPKDRSEESGDV